MNFQDSISQYRQFGLKLAFFKEGSAVAFFKEGSVNERLAMSFYIQKWILRCRHCVFVALDCEKHICYGTFTIARLNFIKLIHE